MHRRSGSISHQLEGLHPGPELSGLIRPLGTPNLVDADVFPPPRSQAPDPSIFLPYMTEDIAFEEEYEEYLSDLGWSDEQAPAGANSAWHRLPEYASNMADGMSDSESIVSIGDLGDDSRLDPSRDDADLVDENLNNWEVSIPRVPRVIYLIRLPTAHEPQDNGSLAEIAGWSTSLKFRRWPSAGVAIRFR